MSDDNLKNPSTPHEFSAYGAKPATLNPNFENGDFAPFDSAANPPVDLEACWEKVSARMRIDLGDAAWRSWIKPLRVGSLHNNMLTIEADSSLARDRVNSQYADRLRVISAAEFTGVKRVEVRLAVRPQSIAERAPRITDNDKGSAFAANSTKYDRAQSDSATGATPEKFDPLAGLDPRYTFANFVVGKPNELAFAVARRTAESEKVAFNPLFLYGGVGLGKTHLMHAIAWHIREQAPSRKVMYLSAEKFMYRFVRALRFRDTMSFKEQFRSVDVLMIDDVQFISGKDSTQEEFFHTFNALVEDGRQVIISADKSPTDLEGMEERLRSRLGWGMVADIHPADYELRLGILQAKAERAQIQIPDKVLEFLAHKIVSNVRELEGALNRIMAHAMLVGREITIESAADLLADLLRASSRQISVDAIQKRVAAHYGIRVSEMFSARRARNIARPRQVAMYLTKNLTSLSYPEIGRQFGGRDHTTVMHAVKTIETLTLSDSRLGEDVDLLRSLLSN
ncbi:chromosomal replication initiator protein DnaA [Candidatus Puniceispirillum marinum]|uniref:Chromosomal replication initiator protein DnaA n=1 Tax=Puniceispirillum marinum (strain IMCC1322) TaxID=488538 RepID=D5BU54_PUNMI|nr:chromosomal replication initiator protein DnaA [Candidatus Puniceispirillum marinum]ADE39801.1 ATPase [Candidatus Puniceispirillum marinum IMCC1322]